LRKSLLMQLALNGVLTSG